MRINIIAAAIVASLLMGGVSLAQDLVQLHQDFSTDPGWEGVQNRIVASDAPPIKQDFGWSRGKIGGIVWQSRTPAYYAMALPKALSYDDAFSFSCRIAFMPVDRELSEKCSKNAGNAYIGFFNSERQGYRPWSSVAIRLNGGGGDKSSIGMWLAYMSADYGAGGHDLNLGGRPWVADGKPHTLKLSYDPNATFSEKWTDEKLKSYIGPNRSSTDEILERARQQEPDITPEQLLKRLNAAVGEGLVLFGRLGHQGRDQDTWDVVTGPRRGALTVEFDGRKIKTYLTEEHRRQRLMLDRFGIFNHQVYHQYLAYNISDLTVNGSRIGLATDPKWEAVNNRAEYVDQDFQRQDFGYSPETNYAGGEKGEIGGLFSRTDYRDPLHGYYADEVGPLTLDDPISFSGKLGFPAGNTDAGMFIGYFDAEQYMKPLATSDEGRSVVGSLGIFVEATSARGYDFSALVHPIGGQQGLKYGMNFVPRKEPYAFSFDYDPKRGDGFGQIRFSLDSGEVFTQNLSREQREAGLTLDRFGILSRRVGGTYVVLYFDDLTYTPRRAQGQKPVRHKQEITTVSYPRGGRDN